MQTPIAPITTLVSISLGLIGCAGTKESVLPQDGPTMQHIYERHMQDMGTQDAALLRAPLSDRPVTDGAASLHGYTRQAHDELDTIFPRLPNPSLVMYVFPHLAGEAGVPVPGYVTTFPMYQRVEYALPGELPGGEQKQ